MVGQLSLNFTDQDFMEISNGNQFAFLKDNSGYFVDWMGARIERRTLTARGSVKDDCALN